MLLTTFLLLASIRDLTSVVTELSRKTKRGRRNRRPLCFSLVSGLMSARTCAATGATATATALAARTCVATAMTT